MEENKHIYSQRSAVTKNKKIHKQEGTSPSASVRQKRQTEPSVSKVTLDNEKTDKKSQSQDRPSFIRFIPIIILILFILMPIAVMLFNNNMATNKTTDSGDSSKTITDDKLVEETETEEEPLIPDDHQDDAEYRVALFSGTLNENTGHVKLRKSGTRVYINEEKCYAVSPEYDLVVVYSENKYMDEGNLAMITGMYSDEPKQGDIIVYWDNDNDIHFGFVKSYASPDVIIDSDISQEFLNAVAIDITDEDWAWNTPEKTNSLKTDKYGIVHSADSNVFTDDFDNSKASDEGMDDTDPERETETEPVTENEG